MAVTILDVAREAGVSTATVSRVLNGSGYVSESVRERVLAAVERLNYRPNHIARSLKLQATGMVGLVVPDIANPFFMGVARAAEARLARGGYLLLISSTEENAEQEYRYMQALAERRVEGILLATSGGVPDYAKFLGTLPMPLVLLDRLVEGWEGDAVLDDNVGGAYRLTQHLLEAGYRRIAFVSGPVRVTTGAERLAGYRQAMAEAGLSPDPELIAYGDFREAGGMEAATALLAQRPRPEAILCANNLMAVGVLRVTRRLGLRIPDDLALASFGDTEFGDLMDPSITVAAQRINEVGDTAARLLLRRLAGQRSGRPRVVRLPPRLVVRRSTVRSSPDF